MTPAALTPAAKRKAAKRDGAHPRQLRRSASPHAPRRVSGPASRATGSAAVAPDPVLAPPPPVAAPAPMRTAAPQTRARATTPPKTPRPRTQTSSEQQAQPRTRTWARSSAAPRRTHPRVSLPRPRRISFALPALHVALPWPLAEPRPARPARPARAARPRPQTPPLPLPKRALAFVRSLPDHTMLDRLIRGRAWIALLGLMLAGIVFMQVQELKLGAAYGRAVQRTAQLSVQNQTLLASTGELGDTSRIESIAARMGFIMPAPSQTGFLDGLADHLTAALANLRAPNPNLYLNAPTTLNGAIAGTPVTSQVYSLPGASMTSTGTSAASTTGTTTSGAIGTTTTGTSAASTTTGAPASTTGTPASTTGTPASTTGAPASTTGTPAGTTATPPTTTQTPTGAGQATTATPPPATTGSTGGAGVPQSGG